MNSAALARARAGLRGAARVVVFTGAGISAESGVPTFRGAGGLWGRYRPEDLATPEAFARDPVLVWQWYAWRRGLVASCEPNAAHRSLAAWAARREGVTLVTQNVDDLHERAGAGALLKLHGSLMRDRCHACGLGAPAEPVDASGAASLPRCGACGGPRRPDVVWFGELLPEAALASAFRAAGEADACLVVGTAGAVYPAAGVVHAARAAGATIIVVDPGATGFDDLADIRLTGPAGRLVPALVDPVGGAPG